MNLIEQAEDLARKAHHHQFRRDGITPYITHRERVVARLIAQGITDEEILAAAWLHDTIEDGVLVWRALENAGIPENVIETVVVLTKSLGTPYAAYLATVKLHPAALTVKVADILDNLSDTSTKAQILKYASALIYLLS